MSTVRRYLEMTTRASEYECMCMCARVCVCVCVRACVLARVNERARVSGIIKIARKTDTRKEASE